jgi:integrase
MDGEGTGDREIAVLIRIRSILTSSFHQLIHILGNFIIGHFGIALRGPDVVAITLDNLSRDDNGALWLKYRRGKNGQLSRVKLLPEAVALIEKYRDDTRPTLFPVIPYQALKMVPDEHQNESWYQGTFVLPHGAALVLDSHDPRKRRTYRDCQQDARARGYKDYPGVCPCNP